MHSNIYENKKDNNPKFRILNRYKCNRTKFRQQVIAIILLLGLCLSFSACNKEPSNNIFKSAAYSFYFDGKDDVKHMQYYDSDRKNLRPIYSKHEIWIDNILYSCNYGENSILKYNMKDFGIFNMNEWITEDIIAQSHIMDNGSFSLQETYSWCTDGKYIYFVFIPNMEYRYSAQNNAFRIFRVSLNENTIEYLGEEVATTIAIIGDWIYFFDNGYTYSDGTSYADKNRVGIYKMKTDGSQKSLVYGNFEAGQSTYKLTDSSYFYCSEFVVDKNELYFIDCSLQGNGRVCKINTNTAQFEYLSQDSACYFCTNGKDLFYATGTYYKNGMVESDPTNGKDIIRINLSDMNTEKVLSLSPELNHINLQIVDEYLYVGSGLLDGAHYYYTKEEPGIMGKRFKLENFEPESLFGYVEIEKETIQEYFAYWEKDETYVNWHETLQ